MSEIKLDLNEYTNLLRVIAQESLATSAIKRRTGSLMNSVEVTVGGTEDEPKYILKFNNYGLFLDEGVAGTKAGVSGQGFQGIQYKFSGRFQMTGGSLPVAARTSIYQYGIPAKPWVEKAIRSIEDAASQEIENNLPKDIEKQVVDAINSVPPININL